MKRAELPAWLCPPAKRRSDGPTEVHGTLGQLVRWGPEVFDAVNILVAKGVQRKRLARLVDANAAPKRRGRPPDPEVRRRFRFIIDFVERYKASQKGATDVDAVRHLVGGMRDGGIAELRKQTAFNKEVRWTQRFLSRARRELSQ